jgi:hypothetical protein
MSVPDAARATTTAAAGENFRIFFEQGPFPKVNTHEDRTQVRVFM